MNTPALLTLSVSKDGFTSRTVTVLVSRVIFWEVITTLAVFVGGYLMGRS